MNHDTNEIECSWPSGELTQSHLTNLVTKQVEPTDSWLTHKCEIVSCYDSYLNAHLGAKARIDDSTYETEKELGIGKRRHRAKKLSSDEDEENVIIRKKGGARQKATAISSAPVINLHSKKSGVSFLAKKTAKSPIKVVSQSKSKERELNNNRTLKVVRKDRGSKASSLTDLKNICQKKKEEAEEGKLHKLLVSCTSPNWKAAKLPGSEDEDNPNIVSEDVSDSYAISHSLNLALGCSPSKSISPLMTPVKDLLQSPHEISSLKSKSADKDDRPQSLQKKNPVPNCPRSHVSKTLFQESFSPLKSKSTFSDFERKVLIGLKEINEKVEVISANQTKLNLHLIPNEKVLSKPTGMPTLPVKSVKDLKSLLQALEDSTNISTLSTYLSTFVSKDPEQEGKSTMKVMSELLGNCVAKYYNFSGNKGKMGFAQTPLWTVVKGAVSLKLDTNMAETEKQVKTWLKDAPWRTQEDGSDPKQRSSGQESESENSKEKTDNRKKGKSGKDGKKQDKTKSND